MLESELSEHLGYDKHSMEGYGSGNSCNAKTAANICNTQKSCKLSEPRLYQI